MKRKLLSAVLAILLLAGLCPAAGAAYEEMHFSDDLVAYIKAGEGFRAAAYGDSTGWYIGYGCAVNPADYPNGITEAGADALLRQKMQQFADHANAFLKKYDIAVTQGQFDAVCAMSYALGTAWLKAGNRLPDYLIEGAENHTPQEIASAFAAWCHVGSKVNTVALQRRIMEAKMFLNGDYSHSTEGWSWLLLDANGGKNEYSDVAVYPAGSAYGTLPEASRSGKYFAGWQTGDGTVLKTTDTVSGNLSVKAVWSDTPVEASPAETPAPTPEPTPVPTAAPEADPETVTASEGVFSDVKAGIWFEPYVITLVEAGVVKGCEDGLFHPERQMSWGEVLKLVLMAAGYPELVQPKSGHWASNYLNFAVEKKFVTVEQAGNLNAAVTRNDLADLCAAVLELTETVQTSPYADSSRGSALKLFAAGVMEGSFDESGARVFRGEAGLSRAEGCAAVIRVMEYVKNNLILFGGNRLRVQEDLERNTYDAAAFSVENGRVRYEDGTTTVRYGIDVSEFQGNINWNAVAADGIDFAMIRCGYRGYGEGGLHEDPNFRKNIAGALAAGLDVGIYFFSQATNVAEAQEEVSYTLELIRDYDITFPVAYDWEQITVRGARTRYPDWAVVTDCAEVFCEAVAAAGYTPMVYFNPTMAYLHLDLSRIQNYAGWLANYVECTEYAYDFRMWQYGSDGNVAGISGRVDMDIAFTDFAAK